MVVHVYSCLLTGIIPLQIHTGIITWNGTGIFKLIHVPGISGKQGGGGAGHLLFFIIVNLRGGGGLLP